MIALLIAGWVVAVIVFFISLTLWTELRKKFKFQEIFEKTDGYVRKMTYPYAGGKKGAMERIIIRGEAPFEVLIGFKFPFGGTDWFGYGKSRKEGDDYYVVVSTWMAKRSVEFRFAVKSSSRDDAEHIIFDEIRAAKNGLPPDIVCPPHIFQRLGLWA
ncbi:MAG: hypothetical protein PHW72_03460 [Candidatus Pacebacteria bacterium]|nr:hypothetical protein [Candidatus Paceibacterota bacterium]